MSEHTNGVYLDFKAIKANADVRKVLEYLGLLEHLEERGAELSGWCPFGKEHGKGDSFSINVEKRSFQCFACKARGSVLDLVAKLQGVDLRKAAELVAEISGAVEDEESPRDQPGDNKRRPYFQKKTAARPVMSWQEAVDALEAGTVSAENLIVLDLENIERGLGFTRSKRE